jgi:hypothetical protein
MICEMDIAPECCLLLCRFLGRLDDESIHALRRQASEKRQGTKSRESWAPAAQQALSMGI